MVDWILASATLASAIAAACASFFAYQAAKNTKNATNANIANNLLNDYSSDEMRSSLRLLRDYYHVFEDSEHAFYTFKTRDVIKPNEANSISPRLKILLKEFD